jgi:acyl-CoA thioester hydrolase
MNEWSETTVRVRYAETDKMGIVHHSNYPVWFEIGRSEFCRERGFSYLDLEEKEGSLLVVAEVYCRFKSPAYYEDVLTVRTKLGEMRSRTLRFIYEIYRSADGKVLAEGETLHVATDTGKKVRSLSEKYRSLLRKSPVRSADRVPPELPPS